MTWLIPQRAAQASTRCSLHVPPDLPRFLGGITHVRRLVVQVVCNASILKNLSRPCLLIKQSLLPSNRLGPRRRVLDSTGRIIVRRSLRTRFSPAGGRQYNRQPQALYDQSHRSMEAGSTTRASIGPVPQPFVFENEIYRHDHLFRQRKPVGHHPRLLHADDNLHTYWARPKLRPLARLQSTTF